MLGAFDRQIRRDGAGVIEPDHGAARRFRDHVVVDERGAGAVKHRHAYAGKSIADHIARDHDVAQIFAPPGDDPE